MSSVLEESWGGAELPLSRNPRRKISFRGSPDPLRWHRRADVERVTHSVTPSVIHRWPGLFNSYTCAFHVVISWTKVSTRQSEVLHLKLANVILVGVIIPLVTDDQLRCIGDVAGYHGDGGPRSRQGTGQRNAGRLGFVQVYNLTHLSLPEPHPLAMIHAIIHVKQNPRHWRPNGLMGTREQALELCWP